MCFPTRTKVKTLERGWHSECQLSDLTRHICFFPNRVIFSHILGWNDLTEHGLLVVARTLAVLSVSQTAGVLFTHSHLERRQIPGSKGRSSSSEQQICPCQRSEVTGHSRTMCTFKRVCVLVFVQSVAVFVLE